MESSNKSITEKEAREIMVKVRQEATGLREQAGAMGSHGDGGASALSSQIRFYAMGMNLDLPPEWESHYKQVQREADPEYAEYLRLHKKFGG